MPQMATPVKLSRTTTSVSGSTRVTEISSYPDTISSATHGMMAGSKPHSASGRLPSQSSSAISSTVASAGYAPTRRLVSP